LVHEPLVGHVNGPVIPALVQKLTNMSSVNNAVSSKKAARSRAQLSPLENTLVGLGGGMIETYAQMPLITWKYCIQEGRAYPRALSSWFHGGFLQAGSVAPITAFQVAMNGFLERVVTGGRRDLSKLEGVGTALTAGAASALIYGPADLLVIQQQKMNASASATFQAIRANYGSLRVMRGFWATCYREALYTGGVLGLAPLFFDVMKKKNYSDVSSYIGSGITAGTIAALLTHPADTAKTVVQADIAATQYPTARAAFLSFLRNKGIRSLYNGGVPRTLRLSGACIIVASLRELAIRRKTTSEHARLV